MKKTTTKWHIIAMNDRDIIPVYTGERKDIEKKWEEIKGLNKYIESDGKQYFVCGVATKRYKVEKAPKNNL